MARILRTALVLLLASSILVVVPGEVDATVPGAIGRIVYVSTAVDPQGDIYVRNFDGSGLTRLTTSSEPDYSPRWSADGDLIAFGRANGGGGGTDLYVMGPDGSSQTNLTNGGGTTNIPLAWSPDSTRILMHSNHLGQFDLWTIRPDGSDPVRLTDTVEAEHNASWSPDGSMIAFIRMTPGSANIWLMDADGSNPRSLTGTTGTYVMPAWSPDGTRLAYVDGNASYGDIWVMNADGSNRINLTNSAIVDEIEPRWSPDGTRISYTSDVDGDYDIWMMNPDGTGKVHLTDHVSNEWAADWESVNRLPVAVADEVTTRRSGSIEIAPLANDSDPDGEALVVADITRMPVHGTVVINPSGTVTYTHDGWVPPAGHVNVYTDGFEYEVEDSRLGSARAEVVVWIMPGFDDVPDDHLFVSSVTWLARQDITRGCNPPENTMFCPEDPVTRGQMAAFLVRMRGFTDTGGGDLFVDDDGSVFELDIDRLGTAGVTKGCNPPVNDRFCPGEFVTRGQMAAFLVRAAALPDPGHHDLFIDDNGSIFEDSIDLLGATGVSKGCNPPVNDRFCPDAWVTRGQMAAFLYRAQVATEE